MRFPQEMKLRTVTLITRTQINQRNEGGEGFKEGWLGREKDRRPCSSQGKKSLSLSPYLRLLTFVPRPFARRRIRLLSKSLKTAVQILKSALPVPQIFCPSLLALGILG